MLEDRDGFIKLNKDYRRGSNFHYHHPNEYGCGLREDTRIRIHVGFGRCFNMNLKVEKEDGGNLRIGRLSLANNCHIIVLIFGFFFLLAGVVLTIISYKVPLNNKAQVQSSSREQGRVAGPAFIGVGSLLFVLGLTLCLIYWRLNRAEAKRVQIFSVPDAQDARSCPLTPTNVSSFPGSRRESAFTTNYSTGRRKTLPSITSTIPEGFQLNSNENSGIARNGQAHGSADCFGDDRLSVREHHSFREASANSRRKASLSRRPSLASPNFMMRGITPVDSILTTRSDEPYGSIISLGGKKLDIACFPSNKPPQFSKETDSRLSPTSRNLPCIAVNECVNPLIHQGNSFLNVNSLNDEEISNV